MPNFRRYFIPGGTYFFTVVTAQRFPLFRNEHARALLGEKIRKQQAEAPFEIVAIVLLPDHLHTIWTLPSGDKDYSSRWQAIKSKFTADWLESGGIEQPLRQGYSRQRRRGVWQPRFMEHTIRDEDDLHNHADYIHYNPVKHAYVENPKDWPWSSFHRYVKSGDYPEGWDRANLRSPDFNGIDEDLLE